MSVEMEPSSAFTASDFVMISVDAATSRSASSISPSPIRIRPKRPTWFDSRMRYSTTPTKMNSGDSHDRSNENTTVIRLVPMSAPNITASAIGRVTRPWPTNAEMISAVAVLDWTSAVTPKPDMAAAQRLATLWASTLRKLAPNTRRMPVRTRWVPQTSSAMAARRFNKCFIASNKLYALVRRSIHAWRARCATGRARSGPETANELLRAAHPAQLVEDKQRGPDRDCTVGDVESRE